MTDRRPGAGDGEAARSDSTRADAARADSARAGVSPRSGIATIFDVFLTLVRLTRVGIVEGAKRFARRVAAFERAWRETGSDAPAGAVELAAFLGRMVEVPVRTVPLLVLIGLLLAMFFLLR